VCVWRALYFACLLQHIWQVKVMHLLSSLGLAAGAGDCDVGLLAIDQIKRSLSGEYNQDDCKNNAITCVRDDSGKPNPQRDCAAFAVVGPVVLTVPLSFPVAPALFQSFAYTLQQMKADGQQAQIDKDERERLTIVTGSACTEVKSTEDTSSLQLPLASMAGTFIIALIIQLFAIILSIAEYSSGRPVQDWFQAYSHITDKMIGDKNMKFGCPGYMRIVDSTDIAKVFAIFSPCYIVVSRNQQLQYYKSEKDAHGNSLPKRTMSCEGMEIKAESTVTIPKSGRPVHYVLTVELPDSDMFGVGGSSQLECACESEKEREILKEMIVKMNEERDSSALSQYDFQKEMKKRFGPLPNEKQDQDQQAAQVIQQQDVVGWVCVWVGGWDYAYTYTQTYTYTHMRARALFLSLKHTHARTHTHSWTKSAGGAYAPKPFGRIYRCAGV